jgi:lipoprotein NlpI
MNEELDEYQQDERDAYDELWSVLRAKGIDPEDADVTRALSIYADAVQTLGHMNGAA